MKRTVHANRPDCHVPMIDCHAVIHSFCLHSNCSTGPNGLMRVTPNVTANLGYLVHNLEPAIVALSTLHFAIRANDCGSMMPNSNSNLSIWIETYVMMTPNRFQHFHSIQPRTKMSSTQTNRVATLRYPFLRCLQWFGKYCLETKNGNGNGFCCKKSMVFVKRLLWKQFQWWKLNDFSVIFNCPFW